MPVYFRKQRLRAKPCKRIERRHRHHQARNAAFPVARSRLAQHFFHPAGKHAPRMARIAENVVGNKNVLFFKHARGVSRQLNRYAGNT